jgi:hypothetical protein
MEQNPTSSLRLPSSKAPPGFQWALVEDNTDAFQCHYGDMKRFDFSPTMKKFKYDRLSTMTGRIRLLRLMAGPKTSEVQCELFEAEIDTEVFLTQQGDTGRTRKVVPYEALSWSWGSGESDYRVLIRKDNKVERKRCSEGLAWALRYLRHEDKDRVIWVDAICIDQDSVEEKNHQVQMMSQIYSYATCVCVWLGLGDKASRTAIHFIKNEILRLEQFDALCSDEHNAEKWQSLLLLMQRQWFFRRWVVQEIALAKDAVIHCGPDTISWKDFSVAVELFVEVETVTHRLSEVMQRDPRFYHIPRWFEYVSALGASLLVEATGMLFRYYKTEPERSNGSVAIDASNTTSTAHEGYTTDDSQQSNFEDDSNVGGEISDSDVDEISQNQTGSFDESIAKATGRKPARGQGGSASYDPISDKRPLLSLEYLVSKLAIFAATEPRDAIYALLAISNDGYPSTEGPDDIFSPTVKDVLSEKVQRKPFPVDYGEPYANVCQNFLKFCIEACPDASRALDILCRPWAIVPEKKSILRSQPKAKSDDMKKWRATLANLHHFESGEEERLKKLNHEQLKSEESKKLPHSRDWSKLVKYFPEPTRNDRELPSWIPKLTGAPFAMYPHAGMHITKLGRKNADPLVGDPRLSTNYNAAQGREIDVESLRFRKRRSQNAHCMFVKGFILGKVAKSADSSQSGNIPAKWFKLARWDVKDFENRQSGQDATEPSEELWRTLVADRGKDGRNPPYYFSRACKESVFKGGLASGAVNTSDLINNERNSIVAEFCRRVQSVIWGRRLIKTDQGNLGIASSSVKKGDLICILYGCTVPVVLRRVKKKPEVIMEEREEDDLFSGLEAQMEKAIPKLKALIRRKKRWQNLPDSVSAGDAGSKKKLWGKAEVRNDLKMYKEYQEKLRKEGKLDGDHEKGTNQRHEEEKEGRKKAIRESHDCWYRFLGECYIHGMMDGEAIRMKTYYDEKKRAEWKQEKARPGSTTPTTMTGNGEPETAQPQTADGEEVESGVPTQDLGDSASNEGPSSATEEGINLPGMDDEALWRAFRGDTLRDMIFELR